MLNLCFILQLVLRLCHSATLLIAQHVVDVVLVQVNVISHFLKDLELVGCRNSEDSGAELPFYEATFSSGGQLGLRLVGSSWLRQQVCLERLYDLLQLFHLLLTLMCLKGLDYFLVRAEECIKLVGDLAEAVKFM